MTTERGKRRGGKRTGTTIAGLIMAGMLLNGCEGQTELDVNRGAIENGTDYALADAMIMKEVLFERLDGSTLGSGALLRNNWVLTAAHLFPTDRIASPSTTMRIRLGDQVLLGSEIFIAPNGLDVALVRLQDGFLIDGKRTGFSRPLYNGTPASLVGQTLDCWGYGAVDSWGDDTGILRRAPQRVVEAGTDWYGVERNSAGQLLTGGDSGAVCFLNGEATGVHHGRYAEDSNGEYQRGTESASAAFRDWALNQVIDRKASTLHRMTLTCNGVSQSGTQLISLAPPSTYAGYRCTSRYQTQCIEDGSFDSFYMEWCDYTGTTCRKVSSANGVAKYFCDAGARPAGSCQPSKVFRKVLSCDGTPQVVGEQVIDLSSGYRNYTCGNRYVEQCVDDRSWDSYFSEWCEYTCQ